MRTNTLSVGDSIKAIADRHTPIVDARYTVCLATPQDVADAIREALANRLRRGLRVIQRWPGYVMFVAANYMRIENG